jgi:predicted membrane-bound mannosyltransferase
MPQIRRRAAAAAAAAAAAVVVVVVVVVLYLSKVNSIELWRSETEECLAITLSAITFGICSAVNQTMVYRLVRVV